MNSIGVSKIPKGKLEEYIKGMMKRYHERPIVKSKKPCTHEHAFRGKCLTCGEEGV